MDLDGSFIRSMVCCHVGRPATFLNAVVAAAFAAEAAMVDNDDGGVVGSCAAVIGYGGFVRSIKLLDDCL